MKQNFIQKIFSSISRITRPSLRTKVALVFVMPVLILMLLLSYDHYTRDREALQEQVRVNAVQLGSVVLGGLRQLMLVNDSSTITAILGDVGRQGSIQRVWIIDLENVVKQSSNPDETGLKLGTGTPGCVECHKFPVQDMPQVVETSMSPGNLRVAAPIENLPECQSCHSPADRHLGVLLVDASIASMQTRLQDDLTRDLVLAFGVVFIGMFSALALVNWLFIRRVNVIHRALSDFEDGDYSARIEKTWSTDDELTQLADSFNGMADSIVEHENKLLKLATVRQQAIIEERERIARELHDGVAQFIGYVNAKLSAARLLLQKKQPERADDYLAQIEKEVRNQSLDVRSSILGLRIASQSGAGLAENVREYIDQCNRMSDFVIELDMDHGIDGLTMNAEIELQLMRVIQEALSNVRKHASAASARVNLELTASELVITIHDDGVGFSPWTWPGDQQAHFGLQTMRERAEMVGALLSIVSEPGRGTTVTVRLKMKDTSRG